MKKFTKFNITLLPVGVILIIVGGIITGVCEDVFGMDLSIGSDDRIEYEETTYEIAEVIEEGYDGENTITFTADESSSLTGLDIDVKAGTFYVTAGNNLSIETYGIKKDDLDYSIKDGILNVKYAPGFKLVDFSFDDMQINIVVPQKIYENVNFEVKAGELDVRDLSAEKCTLDFTAGDSSFSNVMISEHSDIKISAGDCNFFNCTLNDPDIKMTAGYMFFGTSRLLGSSDIKMTAGSMYINLSGTAEDYNFNIDKTAGNIEIDGNDSAQNITNQGAINTINISLTAGDCIVGFEDEDY